MRVVDVFGTCHNTPELKRILGSETILSVKAALNEIKTMMYATFLN